MTNDYIDLSAVEPLVREAFAAAVARDPARSAVALAAMEGQETECVTLAAMIDTIALVDLDSIDDEYLKSLASRFAEMESWAQFTSEDAYEFLHSLISPDLPPLPSTTVIRLVFVMGAWLLSAFGGPDRIWYEELDRILMRIEAQSPRS